MGDNLRSGVHDFTGYFTVDAWTLASLQFPIRPRAPVSTVTDETTLGRWSLNLRHSVLKSQGVKEQFHNWQISYLALRCFGVSTTEKPGDFLGDLGIFIRFPDLLHKQKKYIPIAVIAMLSEKCTF